mgnify:CR=1 FL=1
MEMIKKLFEYLDYIYHLDGVQTGYGYVCYYKDYIGIADLIPKDKIVVDVGCSFGIQQLLFKDHKRYIGIQKFREGENCQIGFKPNFMTLIDNAVMIDGVFKEVYQQLEITDENRDQFFGIANCSIYNDRETNKEDILIFERLFPKNHYATGEDKKEIKF